MLRIAAVICLVSFCMCAEIELKFHNVTTFTQGIFTSITSVTTNTNPCTNLACADHLCSSQTTAVPHSNIMTLRNLGQQQPCSCSCCGYRNNITPTVTPTLRILGGETLPSNEFPWIVAILKEEETLGMISNDYTCVGSLIHPSVVLTAAHCISKIEANKLKIRVGEHDTTMVGENDSRESIRVAEYIIHQQETDFDNDIALMFLVKPVNITSNVKTICLPPQNANFDLQQCLVSGWGKDKFGELGKNQKTMKTVEMPIVPRNKCLTELRKHLGSNYKLHDSVICAGGETGVDACEGDGGAPLVCKIPGTENRYHQVGIVSWGIRCGEPIPAGYANVAHFRNWIDEEMQSKLIRNSYQRTV